MPLLRGAAPTVEIWAGGVLYEYLSIALADRVYLYWELAGGHQHRGGMGYLRLEQRAWVPDW